MRRKRWKALATVFVATMALSSGSVFAADDDRAGGRRGSFVAPAPAGRPDCRVPDIAQLDLFELFEVGGSPLLSRLRLCSQPFRHPLLALSRVRGPLPLFESLDDPSGRRYVVGETAEVLTEGGQATNQSGLFVAERGPMRRDEGVKTDPAPELVPPPKVNPDLQRVIGESPAGQPIDVTVDVADPSSGLQPQLDRLVAEGQVRSQIGYERARDRLTNEQRIRNERLLGPVVAAFEELGGRVTFRCRNLPCLRAQVPASAIDQLARRGDVVEVDLARPVIEDGMSGTEVRTGAQLHQFLDSPFHFDGNGANEVNESDNVVGAVVEAGGGYPDHDGFRENTANYFRYGTGTNSTGKWQCDLDGCDSVTSFSTLSGHAAGVAGLFFGDLVDGQMPSVPVAQREGASGYAPEARAHLYYFFDPDPSDGNQGSTAASGAFDHIAGLTTGQRAPDLVTNSWSYIENPECSGASTLSRSANRLYRDGIGVLKSAGNRGGSATACRVGAPGAAMGVFTVGAHMWLNQAGIDAADATTVRTAAIYDDGDSNSSSWGGNPSQGQNRSIVSITGPGTRSPEFNASGGLGETVCCTSLATPTVAGSTASFMDFYRSTYSSFIDNPGALYASMLLMGDRQGVSGKTIRNPDHRWGTGRLRMRKLDSNGLDAPASYFNGWTCVAHGETVKFPVVNGSALPTDMEALKASAYWYDTRHDGSDGSGNAGAVADIDLAVVNPTANMELVGDHDGSDNKARVLAQRVGGQRLNVELSGHDVAGHNDPVCGTNAMQVFFTFFAEDSDRESPTFDSGTGAGVYPEDL